MTCEHCHDTGSLSKSVVGFPDCPYCDTAEERMRLEAWARRNAPSAGLVDLWAIYQYGKAAGAVDVARTGA
jgi:hypothetical protein